MLPVIWSATDILGYFLPFYPPNSAKNINFKKMKKSSGDIIILHQCTKKHDYILYCSWDMAPDRCNWCFSFWAISCPFTSLGTSPFFLVLSLSLKISKQWKNSWRYHHFTQVYQKSWSYAILSLRYGTWHM